MSAISVHSVKNSVKNKGFSLIELMIVVAIIGILVAIALPAYNKYVIKTRVAEMFALMRGPQLAIQEYVAEQGYTSMAQGTYNGANIPDLANLPSTACAGTPLTVGTGTGTITASPGTCQGGTTVQLVPTIVNNAVTWTCHYNPAASQIYMPSNLNCVQGIAP